MKTSTLVTSFFFLTSFYCQGNGGGPDAYGYIWRDNYEVNGPVYNWIDISTFATTLEIKLLSDDNTRGPYSLGFDFPFCWYAVNSFHIGSNGYIAFGYPVMSSPFPVIPSTLPGNNFIAAFMSDLSFEEDTVAKCYFWTSSDLDTAIITWQDVAFFTPNPGTNFLNGKNSFQIILSMVDTSITFQYKERIGQAYSNNGVNFLTMVSNHQQAPLG